MVENYFMRSLLFLVLAAFICKQSGAQQRQIDSLEKLLSNDLDDSTRIISMMRLAINYESVDTSKSAALYRETIHLAKDKKNFYLAGRTFHNQAILQYTIGYYPLAASTLDSALYYLNLSNHPDKEFRIAGVYNEKGTAMKYLNEHQSSLEYYLKAIAIFENYGKNASSLNTYLNIASFYKEQQETEKQHFYALKALEKARITQTPIDYFKSYSFVAHALCQKGEYDSAHDFIDSAQKFYNDIFPQEVRISFLLVAGLVNMNLKKYEESKQNFEKSHAISVTNQAVFTEIQSRLQIGRVLSLQLKFAEAEPILSKAFNDAKLNQNSALMIIALEYMTYLYEGRGNYKKALEYHREFKIISDSVSSVQNRIYSSNLEAKYETERKNAQIERLQTEGKVQTLELKQKKTLNYIFMGAAAAVLVIFLLSMRTYRQKQKLQQQRIAELETEKKLSATEAVMKGEERERTRLAKDLHDGLGGMLSGIKYSLNTMKGNLIMTPANAQAFERSMDMLDSSIQEMRRVAHNMMPEALVKFGLDTALQDFCNDISTSGVLQVSYVSMGLAEKKLDQTISITVYRIVQELINNSIKHSKSRTAIVQASVSADQLSITVEDEGTGFDISILESEKGIGWNNINHRVKFLKGKVDINSRPGEGTSVLIELPI